MGSDLLIIEDTYEDIRELDDILQTEGYTVRAARDGVSGVRAARSAPPDLILLDIMLPDQDGFQVCRELRADERLAHIPIIFLSALHDVSLKARAFEAGGYDYLTKPFNCREVLVRVQHQLERVHLRARLQDAARLKERQHVARELHDSVNQTLFVLSATVQSMMMDADALPEDYQAQLAHVNTLSRSALAEMRTLLNELRPSQLRKASIQKLLHQLVDAFRLRLAAEVRVIAVDAPLSAEDKLVLYRIVQEALNNAAKHASAHHVSVAFVDEGSQYRLLVEDDGQGFDPSHIHEGMGLHTMRERAEQHGMSFNLRSALGAGTRIEVISPK